MIKIVIPVHKMSLLIGILTLTPCQHLYPMGAPRAAVGVSSVASAFGAPIGSLLKTAVSSQASSRILASVYDYASELLGVTGEDGDDTIKKGTSMVKKLVCLLKSHNQQESEKKTSEEDERMENNPALKASQQKLITNAVGHLMTIYSPHSYAAKRIEALFALNQITLLGTVGRLFKNGLVLLNRRHFTKEGLLRQYVLPPYCMEKGTYLRELILFLKTISTSKEQFYAFLKTGMDKGISALADYYERHLSNLWSGSGDTLRELAELNAAEEPVGQRRVLSNKVNNDFLKIIRFCSSLPKAFQECPKRNRISTKQRSFLRNIA